MPANAEIRLRTDAVEDLLRACEWGVPDLARKTGLAESTWYRLFKGHIPLTATTAACLLAAFQGDDARPDRRKKRIAWDDLFELRRLDEQSAGATS